MILKIEVQAKDGDEDPALIPQTIFAKVSNCVIHGDCKSYRFIEPIGLALADDLLNPSNIQVYTYSNSIYIIAFDAEDLNDNSAVIGFDGTKVSVSVVSDFPGIHE